MPSSRVVPPNLDPLPPSPVHALLCPPAVEPPTSTLSPAASTTDVQPDRQSHLDDTLGKMASVPVGHSCEPVPKTVQQQVVDPYGTFGQLSFAKATCTTVVTTTTTTTTSLPPMLIKAPRSLKERDSKEYPLAHTPAPESIRKFGFEIDGLQACFEEANNVEEKVQEVRLAGNVAPGDPASSRTGFLRRSDTPHVRIPADFTSL